MSEAGAHARRAAGDAFESGAVMPLLLLLLVLMTATTLSVARTAAANTRLVGSVQASNVAFRLADEATRSSLQAARANPAALPASGHIDLPVLQRSEGTVRTRIRLLGTSSGCIALASLPAERLDYEIQVTAHSTQGALSHHRQGFFICREICPPPCIGAETPAQASYWYRTRPDKP